jgi:hypothetical protein
MSAEPMDHQAEPEKKRRPPKRLPGWGRGRRSLAGELLDVHAAGELLGMTELTVRGQISRGRPPYRRMGGRIVCIRAELLAFLDALPGLSLAEVRRNLEAREGKL